MLETQRLLLRPLSLADFEPLAAMLADEETTRYIGGVQSPPVAWRTLMCMAGAWQLTGVAMFAVIEKATGKWLGRIGPWQPHGWPGTEVGWSLVREAWGRGFGIEAATACMDYAVDVLGWTDIIHSIDPGNTASQRLAQRLGSTLRGPVKLPPPHADAVCEIWGQTREQWLARRGR